MIFCKECAVDGRNMRNNIIRFAALFCSASFLFTGCANQSSTAEKNASADSGVEAETESGSGNAIDNTSINEPQEKDEKSAGVIQFENEYKAISLDDEEKGIHYGEISYELIHIKDSGDEKSNGVDLSNLSEALEELDSEIENNAKGSAEEYKKEYAEDDYFYTDDMDKNIAEFSFTSKILIERADDDAVSLLLNNYEYTGGAHGSSSYVPYNFNTKSGQDIVFSDVLKDTTGLEDKVVAILKEDYPELFEDSDSTFSPEQTARDDMNELASNPEKASNPWYLTPSGVDFIFGEYELGPYASGSQFVELSYDENKDMFNSDISYGEIPDGSLITITSQGKVTVNGKELSIGSTYDEDSQAYTYTTTYDGKEIELDAPENAYFAYNYVARRGEKYFLLTEYATDNMIPELSIYDLGTGSKLPTTYEFSLQNGINNDLSNLTVTKRLDALSTVDATISASFTADGLLTTNGQDYTILSNFGGPNADTPDAMAHTLTAKKDIRCVDGLIKKGAKVRLAKTNADEKAQTITLLLSDDPTVTVLVETKEDGTHTIDGVDENELFDGIQYSG